MNHIILQLKQKRKHSATAPSANNNVSDQVLLKYDPLQYQLNTTTDIPHQK